MSGEGGGGYGIGFADLTTSFLERSPLFDSHRGILPLRSGLVEVSVATIVCIAVERLKGMQPSMQCEFSSDAASNFNTSSVRCFVYLQRVPH